MDHAWKNLNGENFRRETLFPRWTCLALNLSQSEGHLAGKLERGPLIVSSSRLKGQGVSSAEKSQTQSNWSFLDEGILLCMKYFERRSQFVTWKQTRRGLKLKAFETIAIQGSRRDGHLCSPLPSNNKAGAAMVDFLSLWFDRQIVPTSRQNYNIQNKAKETTSFAKLPLGYGPTWPSRWLQGLWSTSSMD